MTSSHFIYIPMVAIGGMILGFLIGARAVRDAMNLEQKREQERAEARRAREERKKKREAKKAAESGDATS